MSVNSRTLLVIFASIGTPPGQGLKIRDCPGHSGTVGNYEDASLNTMAVAMHVQREAVAVLAGG